jgi:hypothetical protein
LVCSVCEQLGLSALKPTKYRVENSGEVIKYTILGIFKILISKLPYEIRKGKENAGKLVAR